MMTTPLLSIAIPTYNRCEYLKQTLAVILAQKTSEVEILVCDNCSNDETWQYLTDLGSKITSFRQTTNAGADENFISCLTQATGQYVWTLGDDDLSCTNTLESLLSAIKAHDYPAALFIRSIPTDPEVSDYSDVPVQCDWIAYDRNGFLEDVGVWCTFGSSCVVRRDVPDMNFLKAQSGSALVPAAIILSAVGLSNQCIISSKPLIYHRASIGGGYNALIVFSENFHRLLNRVRSLGYNPQILHKAYSNSLTLPVVYYLQIWPVNLRGLRAVFRHSYSYPSFYTHVIPAVGRRIQQSIRIRTSRLLKQTARS